MPMNKPAQEPQGEPLEATTPPATAGKWRVWSKHSLRYAKVITDHDAFVLDYMPRELANRIVADHNAASRLRIALAEAGIVLEALHMAGGTGVTDEIARAVEIVRDALKGSSHE